MAPDSSTARACAPLLAAAVFLFAATQPAFAAATVASITAELQSKGAPYVLGRYFFEPKGVEGLRLVKTGRADAVALGVKMLSYSDGGATDDISGALADALVKAPDVVLPYVGSGPAELAATRICLPFLSNEEPRNKIRVLIERTRKALLRVTDTRLQRQKSACMREVDKNIALLR